MALIITPEDKVKQYFEDTDLNQSLLKALKDGLDSFKKAQEEQENTNDEDKTEKPHFILGGGVDLMCTGENGAFYRKYYVSELEKKPSDAEMAIAQHVFAGVEMDAVREPNFQELKDHPARILDACDELNYQPRWKPETRITKITEVCAEYYEDLKKAFGKQVISKEQYNTIESVVMSLKTHPRTAHLFDRESQERDTNLEFYYQVILKFNIKGIPCKAMLDLVIVERNEDDTIKRVYPFDLKTMSGPTLEFPKSVRARRYDFQGAWYTEGLSQHFGVSYEQIENFQFIVESTTEPGNPLVYQMSDELLYVGRFGRPRLSLMDTDLFNNFEKNTSQYGDIILNWEIKGWEQLIDEYLWYEENGWNQDRVIAESNGVLKIDWNGVIPEENVDETSKDFTDIRE